jgi:hypothetical protein
MHTSICHDITLHFSAGQRHFDLTNEDAMQSKAQTVDGVIPAWLCPVMDAARKS